MVRKLAYLLVILAVLTAVGELCGLLLPTLSWPFTVSREMSMLNIVCTDQNNGGLRGYGTMHSVKDILLRISLFGFPVRRGWQTPLY